MIEGHKILAIIPARGGSKGLPGKNIKDLHGKPMLAYTIEAAQESSYIDDIFLSTDSQAIAAVGRQFGLDVPFLRPDHLATDSATTMDVIEHAVNQQGEQYDYVVVLQPTSPLRSIADVDTSLELLVQKQANAVVSVVELDHPAEWANELPPDNRMDNFIKPEDRSTPRQQLSKRFRLNGAVYAARTDYLLTHRNYFHDACYAYIMPRERSVDIDDLLDFQFAEFLMQRNSS